MIRPRGYRIVECCLYCVHAGYRERTVSTCTLPREPNRTVDNGGWCPSFGWDPGYRRFPQELAPAAFLSAVAEKEAAANIKAIEKKAANVYTRCPIYKTGAPNNPCRSCETKPFCPVGQKQEERP